MGATGQIKFGFQVSAKCRMALRATLQIKFALQAWGQLCNAQSSRPKAEGSRRSKLTAFGLRLKAQSMLRVKISSLAHSSSLEAQGSGLKAQSSGLMVQTSQLKAQSGRLGAQGSMVKAQGSGPKAQGSGFTARAKSSASTLGAQGSEIKAQGSKLKARGKAARWAAGKAGKARRRAGRQANRPAYRHASKHAGRPGNHVASWLSRSTIWRNFVCGMWIALC